MKPLFFVVLSCLLFLASCAHWMPNGNHIYNTNDGNVGIGTTNPENKLTVVDDTTTPVKNFTGFSSTIASPSEARAVYGAAINPNSTWNYGGYFTSAGQSSGVFGEASDKERGSAGGVFHSWGKNGRGVIGLGLNNGSNVSNYGGWFDARGELGVGIYAKGGIRGYAAKLNGKVSAEVLEITGGSDLSETFVVHPAENTLPSAGMVVSVNSKSPGNLEVCNKAYDHRVAGIISGAGNIGPGMTMSRSGSIADGEYPIALTGRVYCLADASNYSIEPGDLLTTSNTPGHAMKVIDFTRAQGAILGKAMSSLESGKGLVLVLVSLQ